MTRLAAETLSGIVDGKNVLMMPDMIHGGDATERSILESTIPLRTVTVAVSKGKRYLLDGEFGAAVKSFEAAQQHFHCWQLKLVLFWLQLAPRLVRGGLKLRPSQVLENVA